MLRRTGNHGNHEVLSELLGKYLGTLFKDLKNSHVCNESVLHGLKERERDRSSWVNFGWSQMMAVYREQF